MSPMGAGEGPTDGPVPHVAAPRVGSKAVGAWTPWRVAVVVVCVVAGLLIGTARSYSAGRDLRTRAVDLAALIGTAETRVGAADRAAVALRAGIEAAAAADASPRAAAARASADALAPAAGLTAVAGPGLQVALSDAPRDAQGNLPSDADPNDLVVHQQDVQAVINALWAGGAEAMMIMDQRVVTTSAVRCIGNTLLLGGRTYSPPFVLTAIGNAPRLLAALDVEPGVQVFRRYVDRFGLGYELTPLPDVTLPGYEGSVRLSSARAPR